MKRLVLLLALLPILATVPAKAQHHADSTHAAPMKRMHRMVEMKDMMEMHHRMMADSVIHRHMMADAILRASMHEMMGGEMDHAAGQEPMRPMTPAERETRKQTMRARMMERMETMSSEEPHAMHERMMEAHRRVMDIPEVRARMMADPEMHEMMQRMHEGMKHGPGGTHMNRHDDMEDLQGMEDHHKKHREGF